MFYPLSKTRSPKVPKNWRPVVLLPCMSKLLDSTLNNLLKNLMEENGLMSPLQHAYRSTSWMEFDG